MSEPVSAPVGSTPSILHRAEGLLGLYKPAGMHVFGPDSLAAWLIQQGPDLSAVGPADQPAVAHRLDRHTSGLMLAASDAQTYDRIRQAFSSRQIDKVYLVLVEGEVAGPERIELPLGSRYRRSRRVQVAKGRTDLRGVRPAVTEIEPLAAGGNFCLCRIRILTGVRHQIRAHLTHLGHPVAGDGLYGASQELPGLGDRHFLHSAGIGVDLPGGPAATWSCPLPADLVSVLDGLGLAAEGIPP